MGTFTAINNLLFRRTSTFALVTVAATFFFERAFDLSTEFAFNQINQGKQWKDIKSRYTS